MAVPNENRGRGSLGALGEAEERQKAGGSTTNIFERSSVATHSLGNVGSYMFDSEEERERKFAEERLEAGSVSTFATSKAHTPIDGLAKGVVAFGSGLGRGFLGVFMEPVRGASEGGATGFFSGLGKGLVGLVARPAAGVIELGVKTTEGFANTPSTLSSLVSGQTPILCFASPLAESLQLAKVQGHRHIVIKCLDELEHSGLDKKRVFDCAAHETLVFKFKESFNANQDVNLEAIEPNVIANLFKLYLIELPVPLITPAVLKELMAVAATVKPGTGTGAGTTPEEEDNLKKIKAHLSQLPEENKAVLSEICIVLRKFLKSSSRNGLDLATLSSAFSLCLMRPTTYDINRDVNANTGLLEALTKFSSTEQISAQDKRSIQYLTKHIISSYQPGYLTYNLYD